MNALWNAPISDRFSSLCARVFSPDAAILESEKTLGTRLGNEIASYQDGVEYGWRFSVHGSPSEICLSNVCFGHKQETNCLRKAESFLYRLALSTNCYLGVLNVFFSSTCLASYFRFREKALKTSGNPKLMMKNPREMENQVYLRAETKVCAHSLIVSFCKERFITCNIALILWYCFESCWIHFDSDRFTNVAKVSLVLVWFSFWHL